MVNYDLNLSSEIKGEIIASVIKKMEEGTDYAILTSKLLELKKIINEDKGTSFEEQLSNKISIEKNK